MSDWVQGVDALRREQWTLQLPDGRSFVATKNLSDGIKPDRWRLTSFNAGGSTVGGASYVSLEACQAAVDKLEGS